MHFKPTETFQYTLFSSCHPPGVKRGFIKGEALRLLRTNSSKTLFKVPLRRKFEGLFPPYSVAEYRVVSIFT